VIALALFVTGTALGQDADAALRERARAEVDRAVAAFEASDFQTALEGFRAAYALVARDELRFNLGMCYERLGRLREAGVEYEAAAVSESLPPGDRGRARELAAATRARLAIVRVEGAAGRSILVDGVAECVSPCEVRLDPGRHVVTGLGREPRTIEAEQGATVRLEAEAEPEPDLHASDTMPPADTSFSPGALFWIGSGLAVAGGAAILGFGLRASDVHETFEVDPREDLESEGALMRDLANASIALAAVGGVLVLVDVLLSIE
jgi:hypothetical protein